MKDFLKTMKSLSDPNRVKILKMLQVKDMCVCEIQAILKISQPAVSKHLKNLEDAGFIDHRKDGLWVIYSLSKGDLNPYVATMLGNIRHWMEHDPEIEGIKKESLFICKESLCEKYI